MLPLSVGFSVPLCVSRLESQCVIGNGRASIPLRPVGSQAAVPWAMEAILPASTADCSSGTFHFQNGLRPRSQAEWGTVQGLVL